MRYRSWHLGLLLFSSITLANDEVDYMQETDFIEFMGSWETADGEWVHPDEIEIMRIPEKRTEETQKDIEVNEVGTDE